MAGDLPDPHRAETLTLFRALIVDPRPHFENTSTCCYNRVVMLSMTAAGR